MRAIEEIFLLFSPPSLFFSSFLLFFEPPSAFCGFFPSFAQQLIRSAEALANKACFLGIVLAIGMPFVITSFYGCRLWSSAVLLPFFTKKGERERERRRHMLTALNGTNACSKDNGTARRGEEETQERKREREREKIENGGRANCCANLIKNNFKNLFFYGKSKQHETSRQNKHTHSEI